VSPRWTVVTFLAAALRRPTCWSCDAQASRFSSLFSSGPAAHFARRIASIVFCTPSSLAAPSGRRVTICSVRPVWGRFRDCSLLDGPLDHGLSLAPMPARSSIGYPARLYVPHVCLRCSNWGTHVMQRCGSRTRFGEPRDDFRRERCSGLKAASGGRGGGGGACAAVLASPARVVSARVARLSRQAAHAMHGLAVVPTKRITDRVPPAMHIDESPCVACCPIAEKIARIPAPAQPTICRHATNEKKRPSPR